MSSRNLKDLTGRAFGRWTVLRRKEPKSAWPKPRWEVLCECGTVGAVYGSALVSGRSKSCGCGPVGRRAVHGMEGTPEYKAWSSMRSRCSNPNNASYSRYGGRGIRVSKEWDDFSTFLNDVDMRPSPIHSLERKDNDGDYGKGNCRWATPTEQANNRSTNRKLTAFGRTLGLSEWGAATGMNPDTIARRIDRWGWPVRDALTLPIKRKNSRHETTSCI